MVVLISHKQQVNAKAHDEHAEKRQFNNSSIEFGGDLLDICNGLLQTTSLLKALEAQAHQLFDKFFRLEVRGNTLNHAQQPISQKADFVVVYPEQRDLECRVHLVDESLQVLHVLFVL